MDFAKYPVDDKDAAARAVKYEKNDPLGSVPHSLLSSAEIADYARVTGMVYPFDLKQLKSASYEVYIGGEVIWWDEAGVKQKTLVARGDKLVLKANSIVFVQVEPAFRLPNYIAIRFNLRITHVHRGVLLGTGPLVDPGFHGKLLIPLHNLTSAEYDLDTNEALIWIEFTKTTFGFVPKEELAAASREFKGFPPNKRWMTPEQYLRKANGPHPIQSSIPVAVLRAQESAREANESAEKSLATSRELDNKIRRYGIAAAIGALVVTLLTLAGLGFALYQIGQQFVSMVQSAQSLVAGVQQSVSSDIKATTEKLTQSQEKIDRLSVQVNELNAQIDRLKTQNSTPQMKSK